MTFNRQDCVKTGKFDNFWLDKLRIFKKDFTISFIAPLQLQQFSNSIKSFQVISHIGAE
jgi:hypothetical protein